jgi:hypothetical protein
LAAQLRLRQVTELTTTWPDEPALQIRNPTRRMSHDNQT